MLFFFPRGVLDEILNLIESVSEGFPSYFKPGFYFMRFSCDGLFQKSSFCLNARERNMP